MAATRKSAAPQRPRPASKSTTESPGRVRGARRDTTPNEEGEQPEPAGPRRRAPPSARSHPGRLLPAAIRSLLGLESGPLRMSLSIAALLRVVAANLGRRLAQAAGLPWPAPQTGTGA